MPEQNKNTIFSYEDVHNICNVLGVFCSAETFSKHPAVYARLKKNYENVIDNYVARNAKDLLGFAQEISKEKNIPLPLAVGEARHLFKQKAVSLIKQKQLSVNIPNKMNSLKDDSITSSNADFHAINEKIKNWQNHRNCTLLFDGPAKELMRRCNFAELEMLLNDLAIPKKDNAWFKMNLSRYNGSLSDFLADFEQKKLPYFRRIQHNTTVNFISEKPIEPANAAVEVTLSPKINKISYKLPAFSLSKSSLFNWLKGRKKFYKIASVRYKKMKQSLNFSMPKAKMIKLNTSFYAYGKKTLKYAAITVPFFALEFLGYQEACKASEVKRSPVISVNNSTPDNFGSKTIKMHYKQISDAISLTIADLHIKDNIEKDFNTLLKDNKKEDSHFSLLTDNSLLDMKPMEYASARISSHYGYRTNPISGRYRLHTGVDYAAPAGSHIYASADGVVKRAEWAGGYGRYVVIQHNDEYSTAYAHMSGFATGIRPGMKVKKGDVIGFVGSTGNSTGPHLHFEVIKHGRKVNPLALGQVRVLASR